MSVTKKLCAVAVVAAALTLGLGAPLASAQQSPLVGVWACTAQANGITYNSRFDYRADGTYLSSTSMSAGNNLLEGSGGGHYRYANGTLEDTKERATLDRYIRNGVEVPSTDPEWQSLSAQSQANIGQTVSGPIQINGDTAQAGGLSCRRQ